MNNVTPDACRNKVWKENENPGSNGRLSERNLAGGSNFAGVGGIFSNLSFAFVRNGTVARVGRDDNIRKLDYTVLSRIIPSCRVCARARSFPIGRPEGSP